MSRAGRARKVAAAAAFGGGGLTVLTALGLGVITFEVKLARRWIGQPFGQAPDADGLYGDGVNGDGLNGDGVNGDGPYGDGRPPIELVVLGDSSAAGLGADTPEQTPGAVVARGLAAVAGRPVRLTSVAAVGAESAHLDGQIDRLLVDVPKPAVALIMVGANDVTHRVRPVVSVRYLGQAVGRLRDVGCAVVVGTCPDLGTIEPVPQPLSLFARRWSRDLAAAQTVATVEAGGRSVSLGDLLGPEFRRSPGEMFSADRFHPSGAGYAHAAAAVLPSVCAALGLWPDGGAERAPDLSRGEGVGPIAVAAVAAAEDPGSEVSAAEVGGQQRGPRGRWAVLLRRRREPTPDSSADDRAGDDSADAPRSTLQR